MKMNKDFMRKHGVSAVLFPHTLLGYKQVFFFLSLLHLLNCSHQGASQRRRTDFSPWESSCLCPVPSAVCGGGEREKDLCDSKESIISLFPKLNADWFTGKDDIQTRVTWSTWEYKNAKESMWMLTFWPEVEIVELKSSRPTRDIGS